MIKFLGWLVGVTFVLLFMKGCKTIEEAEYDGEGEVVTPPRGHVVFCVKHPDHPACLRKGDE